MYYSFLYTDQFLSFFLGEGYGQLLGLQLVSISEDKSIPDELTDLSTEHLVQFQSTNLHSTEQKSIAVRNTT